MNEPDDKPTENAKENPLTPPQPAKENPLAPPEPAKENPLAPPQASSQSFKPAAKNPFASIKKSAPKEAPKPVARTQANLLEKTFLALDVVAAVIAIAAAAFIYLNINI